MYVGIVEHASGDIGSPSPTSAHLANSPIRYDEHRDLAVQMVEDAHVPLHVRYAFK